MKIAIVGYGKMGRMIEKAAEARGIEVALKLDEFNNAKFEGITAENFAGIDVAIDFSIPSARSRTSCVLQHWASTWLLAQPAGRIT